MGGRGEEYLPTYDNRHVAHATRHGDAMPTRPVPLHVLDIINAFAETHKQDALRHE